VGDAIFVVQNILSAMLNRGMKAREVVDRKKESEL
jgi:hypothetical protein